MVHHAEVAVADAGGQSFAPAVDISPNGWRAVLDLNLTAVFALTRAAHASPAVEPASTASP